MPRAGRTPPARAWVVYVVRCADQSLYCGITNDLPARLAAHEAGRGARYTRGRGPLQVVATVGCRDKRVALRVEHAVKRLRRPDKLALDRARLASLVARARRQLRADLARAARAARARAGSPGEARAGLLSRG